MKGPAIFLLSLVGVAAASFVVLLPAVRERDALAERVARETERTTSAPGEPAGIARLSTALGLSRSAGEPSAAVRSLALDFAPMSEIAVDGDRIRFPVAWADVPRLLGALAGQRGIVVRSFRAEPGESPGRCRVTLELAPPPTGFGVR
jgi:hypothetical protein